MESAASLKHTPLHAAHEKLGARLVEFGGWHMPVQYKGIVEEHKAVREAAGVFDISHMGEFFLSGAKAGAFLNGLLTNDVNKLEVGQGQYTLMLNEQGGVIDDLIIYRLHDAEFLLIVNASMIDEDRGWIQDLKPEGLSFRDASDLTSALALQGPRALEIARSFFGPEWPEPARNQITKTTWHDHPVLTARTGYTGEDGLEFFFPNEIAEELFFALLEAGQPLGLKPCGLGARDTLRLEACLPLNGRDLSSDRTPLEAGLGFFVSLTKEAAFPGKEVLLNQKAAGLKQKLIAFRLTGGGPPPRPHYPLSQNGNIVGEVTSGAPSPTLGYGIGMGYVQADCVTPGTLLTVKIRETEIPVEVIKKPFYKRAV